MSKHLHTDENLIPFGDHNRPHTSFSTVIDLIGYQVEISPAATAIEFHDKTLTYHELNTRSNQLAHYLVANGVCKGQLVPICMERSPEMIIGVLGILKAGGAYVPIEPSMPAERINYILTDTNASILLTHNNEIQDGITNHCTNICVSKQREAIEAEPITNLITPVTPRDLAYVIYTSGSTGKPKGVLIEHKSLAASTRSRKEYYGDMESVFLIPSFAFDASVAVLFGTLICGGKILLCRDQEIKETSVVKKMLEQARMILCVPAYYQFLLDEGLIQNSVLRCVILGGEKLEMRLVDKHYNQTKNIALYNEYGPTEATVWSTVAAVKKGINSVTIGRPVKSVSIYIVDANMQLVPQGTKGEICIGGVQVARGYLNLPGLTAEKFVDNPFSTAAGLEKIYKTGDLGMWLADGNIEYHGRLDEQVKIRGYRIEPGEIENIVEQSGFAKKAVVVSITNTVNEKQLLGFIVPGEGFSREALAKYLDGKLPDYMIPAAWIELTDLPLTSNGKVDKQALSVLGAHSLVNSELVAPSNAIEKDLVNIWQELLSTDRISVRDNFFALGGNSLLVMRMVSMVGVRMKMQLSVNDVFIHKTVSALATILTRQSTDPEPAGMQLKYLVPIRTTGTNSPLYLIAGGGGSAGRFMRFAEMLDPNQPVYALQPPIDRRLIQGFPKSIESIAAKFIEEISAQNPAGPYSLGGHCLGGIIAYEMAKQLEKSGKKVNLLAMFDTVIDKKSNHAPASFNNFFYIPAKINSATARLLFKISFETFLVRKHTRQAINYKINSFKKLVGKIRKSKTKEMDEVGLELFDESSEVYARAASNYKLTAYNGHIELFYAKEHYFFTDRINKITFHEIIFDEATKTAWKEYARSITVHEIEGEHSSIFEPIVGENFAKTLQQKLHSHDQHKFSI